MIKDSISIEEAIEYLNSLVKCDSIAIRSLLCNRVPCNKALADHPTAQVLEMEGGYTIGLMGVICGMFGFDPETMMGGIAYSIDQEKNRLVGFVDTRGKPQEKGP